MKSTIVILVVLLSLNILVNAGCGILGNCPSCLGIKCSEDYNYPTSATVPSGDLVTIPAGNIWHCEGTGCNLGSTLYIEYAWMSTTLKNGTVITCYYNTVYSSVTRVKTFQFLQCSVGAGSCSLPGTSLSLVPGNTIANAATVSVDYCDYSGYCFGVDVSVSC